MEQGNPFPKRFVILNLSSFKERETFPNPMFSLQDYTLIARKACLDPATLTKVLPNSPQLNDRIEALHNQVLIIAALFDLTRAILLSNLI